LAFDCCCRFAARSIAAISASAAFPLITVTLGACFGLLVGLAFCASDGAAADAACPASVR
jgi:hypothetical protein